MKNEFTLAFKEIAEARALPTETIVDALQNALISAYRKDTNASQAQRVEAHIEPDTGRARIYVEKEVVEDVMNPHTEVELEKARYYEPEAQYGDTVMVQVEGTTKRFGRIAAQTAKQVILQKIREAERNVLYDEFSEKEGDIVNGRVQSVNANMATISLGRAEAILPRAQQIPGERFQPHDQIRCYVLEVKRTNRGPQIVVSRSHRDMLRRLLEFEVPEIYNGQIEIKNIAREAGHRSKVAVSALQEGIDPVGACVGMRGIRIQNIVKELHEEKIDVIEWNPSQETFIEKALSPARVTGVYLNDDPDSGRTAVVIVPDSELSLAIGREGQNARLAAKLTGWRIDIKSVSEAMMYALEHLDTEPLMDLMVSHPELVAEIGLIAEKKEAGRAIMPEDYRLMAEFADLAEKKLQSVREQIRQARLAEINAVKSTLPENAFAVPVDYLDLPEEIIEKLRPHGSVGEVMLRFLIDEKRIRKLFSDNVDETLLILQEALDKVVIPDEDEIEALLADVTDEDEISETEADETTEEVAEAEPEAAPVEEEIEASEEVEVVAEEVEPEPLVVAFPEDEEFLQEREERRRKNRREEANTDVFEDDEEELLFEEEGKSKSKRHRKRERQKRRTLVFDEETGETYARRRRKGGRRTEEWEEF